VAVLGVESSVYPLSELPPVWAGAAQVRLTLSVVESKVAWRFWGGSNSAPTVTMVVPTRPGESLATR